MSRLEEIRNEWKSVQTSTAKNTQVFKDVGWLLDRVEELRAALTTTALCKACAKCSIDARKALAKLEEVNDPFRR